MTAWKHKLTSAIEAQHWFEDMLLQAVGTTRAEHDRALAEYDRAPTFEVVAEDSEGGPGARSRIVARNLAEAVALNGRARLYSITRGPDALEGIA